MADRIDEYTPEVRNAAIKRVIAGETKTSVHQDTKIAYCTISKWVREYKLNSTDSARIIPPHIKNPQYNTVLVIPDMHHPFAHPHALVFLKAVRDKYNPTDFLCLGDEVDFHALSRWPHDPNGLSAGHELKESIEALIPFYLEFPNMKVCESNHTVRGQKAAFGAGIPSAFMNHIATVLNAPDGWKWANHWEIDGVRYIHGDSGKSGQNAHIQYLKVFKQSVVIGHIHSYAGVSWEGNHFAVNSGCLIDSTKYAFAYAKNMPIPPSLGCTLVFGGKRATFIPMLLDSNGNWTGEL